MAKITTIDELREAARNRENFVWKRGGDGKKMTPTHNEFSSDQLASHVLFAGWTAERKPWEPEPGKLIYVRLNHGFWTVRRFVGMQDDLFITEHPDAPSPNVVPDQSWPHAKPIDPTEVSK